MAIPAETPDDRVDRADSFMYASKRAGCNRVTTDTDELISKADRPILGTTIPWIPRQVDQEPGVLGREQIASARGMACGNAAGQTLSA
jgi:hypothetical protein